MRAGAGGRGREEGRGPRRGAAVRNKALPCRRGTVRGGSPPAKGAAAGRRGRWRRLPGPEAGRARGGSSPWAPRRLWEPRYRRERESGSTFYLPRYRRPHCGVRWRRSGSLASRCGPSSWEKRRSGPSGWRRLRASRRHLSQSAARADGCVLSPPPGPPLSKKPRPTAARPPPSRQFPRGLKVWLLAAGGRTRVGRWGGGQVSRGAAKNARGARERGEAGSVTFAAGSGPAFESWFPRSASLLGPPPHLRRRCVFPPQPRRARPGSGCSSEVSALTRRELCLSSAAWPAFWKSAAGSFPPQLHKG